MTLREFFQAALLGTFFCATPLVAAPVAVLSYSSTNGPQGILSYRDMSYNGSGDVGIPGSALSGGTGDLTDGIIAADNWYNVESLNASGLGPYVGWVYENPIIDFYFAAVTDFASITFHFDDSNYAGGVSPPLGVLVNGISAAISDPAGSAPFFFSVDLSSLAATDHIGVQIFGRSEWIFVSEVSFASTAAQVPVPASLPLLAGGIGLIAALRRRKA